jgi:hypothetical protein
MYSLFLLLFKKSYWQMLLSGSTWRSAGHSLRRAHKDRRALKHLGRLAWLCLIPILCLAYLAWLAGTGAIYLLPFVIPVIWFIRRNHKRNDPAALSLLQKPAPIHRELTPEDRATLRTFFAKLALTYAVFIDRAGSEAFLKEKVLPEGVQVVSRRIHIDLLKTHGLWDLIGPDDRVAMMMPDGAWDQRHIHIASTGFEALRLLRWILRIDFYLPAIGQQLQFSYKLANELVRAPEKLLGPSASPELALQPMLETGRDVAREYLIRCYAEEVTRGYSVPEKEDTANWAQNLAQSLSGKQSADLVLDGKLVSEADEPTLRRATQLARMRMDYLNWAIYIENNPTPPQLQVRCFPPEPTESDNESLIPVP